MFICFDGIDGAGKSTQARILTQRLTADGVDAELVADPGTTPIGTAIRQILLHNDTPITPVAQMLLFSAARAELTQHIKNRVAAGAIIVCDRWLLSTLVYQGVLNGLKTEDIMSVFQISSGLYPDICFVLDLSPAAAKKRMGQPRDRYERCSSRDCEKMRTAYVNLANKNYAKFTYTLKADAAPDITADRIYRVVSALRELTALGFWCYARTEV